MPKLELQELKSTQIHVFRQDELPYSHLNTKVFISSLIDSFGFQSHVALVAQNGVGPGYDFFAGVMKTPSKIIPVEQFRFEPLRLSLVVVGDSADAELVFEAIVTAIQGVDPRFKPVTLTVVEQTSCVANLDLDFRSLLDPRLIQFLEKTTKEVARSKGNDNVVVEPRVFRATIRTPDKNNKGHNIGGETLITIEPRVGTELSERRYFLSAPVGSSELIRLIEKFEKLFKSTK
jgi:hypothetical protein